jgi:hypothetical protein
LLVSGKASGIFLSSCLSGSHAFCAGGAEDPRRGLPVKLPGSGTRSPRIANSPNRPATAVRGL